MDLHRNDDHTTSDHDASDHDSVDHRLEFLDQVNGSLLVGFGFDCPIEHVRERGPEVRGLRGRGQLLRLLGTCAPRRIRAMT